MKFTKKSLGQNFLIDKNVIRKIINSTKINGKDIIEIGPGTGALTGEILKREPKSLSLIEKDKYLVEKLKLKYLKNKFVKIYSADILNFKLEKICKKNTTIFGNLPYNISSQILVKLLRFQWLPNCSDIIFMFQKELGEKIIGKFPSKKYGRISILTNYKLEIIKSFLVSPNCFFPKPKVNSMVIHFKPKKQKLFKIKKIKNLEKVTNVLFSNKRKMINKNLRKILSDNKINKINNLKTDLRPTDIKPEIYYRITELYEN
tara:strand:+ start:284 stop:1063 length:780 start_codon:yes stop_codon:yes gene_type:complete